MWVCVFGVCVCCISRVIVRVMMMVVVYVSVVVDEVWNRKYMVRSIYSVSVVCYCVCVVNSILKVMRVNSEIIVSRFVFLMMFWICLLLKRLLCI